MNHFFENYFWKSGKPYGKKITDPSSASAYKIVSDPYHKRISIEKYEKGLFKQIVYDSVLFDFRHLKMIEQQPWERINSSHHDASSPLFYIKDENDRLILQERLFFENSRCIACQLFSIHDIPLSHHKLYYSDQGHPFSGVVLYDNERKPVMCKKYELSPDQGFTDLIEECWDMEFFSLEIHHAST